MDQANKHLSSIVLTIIGMLVLTNLNGQDISDLKWKNRILIIQTSNELSKRYQNQLEEFNDSDQELKERKIVVYEVIKDKYKMTDYQKGKSDHSWKNSTKFIKKFLDESDSFKVILIGLDGGIKVEQTTILLKEELFRIIDSMPMRMEEIRAQRMKKASKNN